MIRSLAALALLAISLVPVTAQSPKRQLLQEMFVAMRVDVPADAPQVVTFERHLSEEDIKAITAFFATPAGQHLAAANAELNQAAIKDLEAAISRSKRKRTMADLQTLAVAVEAYATDHNAYPATMVLDDLSRAVTPTYLRSMIRLDGWGKEYIYISDTESYRILSAGADGRLGPDSQKLNAAPGDFGDDLIFENGEFVQPGAPE